jgi:hypothetical protein
MAVGIKLVLVVVLKVALVVALVLVIVVFLQPSTDHFYLLDILVFDQELPVPRLYVDH